eukprot:jgi/Antlo1/61/1254
MRKGRADGLGSAVPTPMLQERKIMIACRLKKTIDTSNTILREINESIERIICDNGSLVTLSRVFGVWVDKVSNT